MGVGSVRRRLVVDDGMDFILVWGVRGRADAQNAVGRPVVTR
ncbi:hypothetical protein [Rhodococcus jostii]|uniref:Uncharacterized protein n=1 Tax=Rhodococcus jostii TaxID=132919 RepID=A0ABU4CN59_RHOJO|nr:hypothetical protein [Rhodococcus jostii]MDV6284557.1 hypothetical protein [Rhodococcus jostii]